MRALSEGRPSPVAPPPRILIVDDALDNREMYAIFLAHSGFRVLLAADAHEALAQIILQSPDIILAGLVLPDMNGAELCRRIREQCSHEKTTVIAITGFPLEQPEIARLASAGADVTPVEAMFARNAVGGHSAGASAFFGPTARARASKG
jgi:CheY-like chemotaxis protein